MHRCGSTLLLDEVEVNPGGEGVGVGMGVRDEFSRSMGGGGTVRQTVSGGEDSHVGDGGGGGGGGIDDRGGRRFQVPPGFPTPNANTSHYGVSRGAGGGGGGGGGSRGGGGGGGDVIAPPPISYAAVTATAAAAAAAAPVPAVPLPASYRGEHTKHAGAGGSDDGGGSFEAHAMLEAKLLYHSLSVEAGLMQRERDAQVGGGGSEGTEREGRVAMLAPPPPSQGNSAAWLALPAPVPVANNSGAMVLWGPTRGGARTDADTSATSRSFGAGGQASPMPSPSSSSVLQLPSPAPSPPPSHSHQHDHHGGRAGWLALPPPPQTSSMVPAGALQLRGPARAVARAAAAESIAAGIPIAPNPYAAAAADSAAAGKSNDSFPTTSTGGDADKRTTAAPRPSADDGSGAASNGSKGGSVPADFGQPHLFEWEVHGLRLLVESSLVVFQREGQTPMSLKLVDLNAERPNTVGF